MVEVGWCEIVVPLLSGKELLYTTDIYKILITCRVLKMCHQVFRYNYICHDNPLEKISKVILKGRPEASVPPLTASASCRTSSTIFCRPTSRTRPVISVGLSQELQRRTPLLMRARHATTAFDKFQNSLSKKLQNLQKRN